VVEVQGQVKVNVLTGMVVMEDLQIHKKDQVDVVVLVLNTLVVELVKVEVVQVMQMLVLVTFVLLQLEQVA
jgi:hypothetical protein